MKIVLCLYISVNIKYDSLWESVGMRHGFASHFRHRDDLFAPQNLTLSTILFRSCWVPFRSPPFSACRRSFCLQIWPNLSFYSDLVGSHFELRAVHPYWFWPGKWHAILEDHGNWKWNWILVGNIPINMSYILVFVSSYFVTMSHWLAGNLESVLYYVIRVMLFDCWDITFHNTLDCVFKALNCWP